MSLCLAYIKCQALLNEKRVPVPGKALQELLTLTVLQLGCSFPLVAGTLQVTVECHSACAPHNHNRQPTISLFVLGFSYFYSKE